MFFFYFFSIIYSEDSQEWDGDPPSCTYMIEVKTLKSQIIRRILQPGESFCVRGYKSQGENYNGQLYFVFNKLSNVQTMLFYATDPNYQQWQYITTTDSDPGGASVGKYETMIFLNATQESEIHFGYTTFDSECNNFFLSSYHDDDLKMTENLGKVNCYFNGIGGRQSLSLYSNNSKCDCSGFVFPKSPKWQATDKADLSFKNDMGSPQYSKFRCYYYYRRSSNRLKCSSTNRQYLCINQWIPNDGEPHFYGKVKKSNNLPLILGLSLGIPLFVIVVVVFVVLYCCCDITICDMFDCCGEASCKMDIVPRRLKERLITQYSYSDDEPNRGEDDRNTNINL